MTTRYATRPGRPSVNSASRRSARYSATDGNSFTGFSNSNRRRNREDVIDEDENAPTESSFPLWKTVGIIAVVFGCFAVVYPRMFHPMILYAFGYGQMQKAEESDIFAHPSMKHGGKPSQDRPPNFAGPSPQHTRHPGGPMPGMGAQMHTLGEGGGRGTKSIWQWMLPFYTVGVIVFLLYTLSKILWKKPKQDKSRRRLNVRYNADRDRMETNDRELDDGLEGDEIDDGDFSDDVLNNKDLHSLQRRLRDTELAMHEILSNLEQLSTTADPVVAEQIKKTALETLNGLGKVGIDRVGTSENRGRGLHFDAGEKQYINELERALTDFRRFTENYIEDYSRKQRQENQDMENIKVEEGNMNGKNKVQEIDIGAPADNLVEEGTASSNDDAEEINIHTKAEDMGDSSRLENTTNGGFIKAEEEDTLPSEENIVLKGETGKGNDSKEDQLNEAVPLDKADTEDKIEANDVMLETQSPDLMEDGERKGKKQQVRQRKSRKHARHDD